MIVMKHNKFQIFFLHRVHKNGSLIFRFVNKRDEGWYGCEAEDVDGNVAKSEFVRLLVEGKACHL